MNNTEFGLLSKEQLEAMLMDAESYIDRLEKRVESLEDDLQEALDNADYWREQRYD